MTSTQVTVEEVPGFTPARKWMWMFINPTRANQQVIFCCRQKTVGCEKSHIDLKGTQKLTHLKQTSTKKTHSWGPFWVSKKR